MVRVKTSTRSAIWRIRLATSSTAVMSTGCVQEIELIFALRSLSSALQRSNSALSIVTSFIAVARIAVASEKMFVRSMHLIAIFVALAWFHMGRASRKAQNGQPKHRPGRSRAQLQMESP